MRQTKAPEGESIMEELGRAVVNFPLFLIEMVASLVAVTLSDTLVASFALTGAAVGFAAGSWIVGLAVFLTIYSVSRVVGLIANAVGSVGQSTVIGMNLIGQGLVQHGHAVRDAVNPYPTPDEPSDPLA